MYVLVTVTAVFAPAGMTTGWAGEIVVVTSTTPGMAPSLVSVTVHDAPAGSGAMTSGSSSAPGA